MVVFAVIPTDLILYFRYDLTIFLLPHSCPFSRSVEKTKFLLFEGIMLVIAVLSSGMVKFRMSQLERKCSSRLTDSLLNGHCNG